MIPLFASLTPVPVPCTPLPDTVWAGSVVAYEAGPGVEPEWGDPKTALGAPDFDQGTGAVSLGNLGSEAAAELIVAFPGAVLVDGRGPDLTLFEAGPSPEPTELSVSRDGQTWHVVGTIRGATHTVDLTGKVPAGERFSWVRLRTASPGQTRGPWAGPDIDAIGLLHACAAGEPNS